jgi:hypothetical protein
MAIFLSVRTAQQRQVAPVRRGALQGEDVGVRLQQVRQRALVGGPLPVQRLLVGIAPACVQPDLGTDAGDLAVHRLGEELEVLVGRRAVGAGDVVLRLFHLDDPAAGGRDLLELGVEDVGERQDEITVGGVVPVDEHLGQRLGRDRAELHRSGT